MFIRLPRWGADVATAYTPGLKVSVYESLAKRRILPLKGEVLVSVGDRVKPETVVARSFLPGRVGMCNVANKLGIDGNEVPGKMLKKEGDEVSEGEVIALSKSFFGLSESRAESDMGGTIESISGVSASRIPSPSTTPAFARAKMGMIPCDTNGCSACSMRSSGVCTRTQASSNPCTADCRRALVTISFSSPPRRSKSTMACFANETNVTPSIRTRDGMVRASNTPACT